MASSGTLEPPAVVVHREPQAQGAQRAEGERSSSSRQGAQRAEGERSSSSRQGAQRAEGERSSSSRVARDAFVLALVLAAAVAAYRPLLALGHLGWDTYPLILTSRITSAADLLGAFREELMDGRYPNGHFYRPVTTLCFALDHAVWGLEPSGYHLTDLLLLLACAIGVAALGRRLLGPGIGPLVAALLFALHPLHVETLPVAARRADTLALLFTLIALLASARWRARGEGKRGVSRARSEAQPSGVQEGEPSGVHSGLRTALSALAAALAVGSKESGSVVVPLLIALGFAESGPAPGGERLRRALRAGALPLAAVGLVLLVRTAVLGGIGGHPGSSLFAGASRGLAVGPLYTFLLLMPQPVVRDPTLARQLVAATATALVIGLGLLARRPALRRLLLVCGTWLLGCLWLAGVSGEIASWYAVGFLPAFSLLVGALAQGAARWADERRRAASALGAGLTVLLLAQALRFTPLLHAYPEWPLVSRRSHEFLVRVQAAVEHAAPGDVRSVPGIPLGIATPLDRVGVRSALGLAEYSVEAWAELVLAGPPIVVTRPGGAAPSPSPRLDAIRIETTPDPEAGRLP